MMARQFCSTGHPRVGPARYADAAVHLRGHLLVEHSEAAPRSEKLASVRPNVDVDCVCLTEILCCYQEPYPLRISLVLKRSAGPNSDELSEALGQTTGYIQPRCPPSMHRRSGASVRVGRNPRAVAV
jgi:hypothetical protein